MSSTSVQFVEIHSAGACLSAAIQSIPGNAVATRIHLIAGYQLSGDVIDVYGAAFWSFNNHLEVTALSRSKWIGIGSSDAASIGQRGALRIAANADVYGAKEAVVSVYADGF